MEYLAAGAVYGTIKGIASLFGNNGSDERMKTMQRQHEEAMARLRQETVEQIQAEGEKAVDLYKKGIVEQRVKYPRPAYLPDDGVPMIGVSGGSGAGKSMFINTILGKKVAKTGTGETTTVPGIYQWGNVYLVDLPGGCTTKFKAEDYFRDFGVRYFDAIVWLSTDARLTELGMDAIKHLSEYNVPTMFVLSKVEGVLDGEAMNGVSEEEAFENMEKEFNNILSKYFCPVYLLSAQRVQEECGSLAAVPTRRTPLTWLVNRDWLPLLQVMKREAILRRNLLSRG